MSMDMAARAMAKKAQEEVQAVIESGELGGPGIDLQARREVEEVNAELINLSKNQEETTAALAEKANKNEVQSLVANKAEKTYVDQQVSSLGQLKLEGVYDTLVALETAKSTGATGLYLVIADGFTYRWNGTSWTKASQFQSTGIARNSITPLELKLEQVGSLSGNLVTTTITGKYVNALGVETPYGAGSQHGVTDFIPVVAGKKYRYFAYATSNLNGAIYNSNKQFIQTLTAPSTAGTYVDMDMPANAAFVRLNYSSIHLDKIHFFEYLPQKYSIEWLDIEEDNIPNGSLGKAKLSQDVQNLLENTTTEIEDGSVTLNKLSQSVIDYIEDPSSSPVNPFDGKKTTWIGDSITSGVGTSSTANRYSNRVVSALSMSGTYQNLGISGSVVSKINDPAWTVKSFIQRICDEGQIYDNQDYIFVLGGLNDLVKNVPVSDMTTELNYKNTNGTWNEYTFYGALNRLITYIRDTHSNSELIYIVPMHFERENTPNTHGHKLIDYIKAIREVCQYYAVPTIDLYNELPIDPKNPTHKNKYTMNTGLTAPDGIHPSNAGNEMIAKKIINYLKYHYVVNV